MGTWQQWHQALKSPWSYRYVAAAVEFVLRALDTHHLLDDVPGEQNVLEALAWPPNLTTPAEREGPRAKARLDAAVPLLPLTATRTWLTTATRVLDDHNAPLLSDWPTFRNIVEGVHALTRRLDVLRLPSRPAPAAPAPTKPPAPAPAPAPTKPPAPAANPPRATYVELVQRWHGRLWSRDAAAEALTWLRERGRGKLSARDLDYSAAYATIVGDGTNPDERVPDEDEFLVGPTLAALATQLDAAGVPVVPYVKPPNAWATARAEASRARDGADVDPGVTTTDLPPRPPGGAPSPPPSGGAPPVAGPYVQAFNRFRTWAAGANGLDTDRSSPRMSREQAAAVLRYIVRQARAHFNAADRLTTAWLPIALAILGWKKRGDTYRLDAPWRAANTGLPTIAELWAYALAVCRQLDAQGVAFDGPHPAPAVDYAVMADEAKKAQLEDDPTMPPPVATAPTGAPAPDPVPTMPVVPSVPAGGAGGGFAVVLLALLAMDAL